MYTEKALSKMAFFDLETASEYKSLDALNDANPRMAELWSTRCDHLRTYKDNEDKTDEELYLDKAALHPEFMRIVCATFTRLSFTAEGTQQVTKSYFSGDETEILDGIVKVFDGFSGYKFCGHNIEKFDIPVMCKRLLINGYKLPKSLMVHDVKPWDTIFVDTAKIWSFGAWQQGFTSLDLLTASLGLPSPKSDIKGADVSRVYWEEENIERIAKYCERDVIALVQVLLKMSGLSLIEDIE